MRFIKEFKLFESDDKVYQTEYDEITSYLSDIFLDLVDLGISFSVNGSTSTIIRSEKGNHPKYITINLSTMDYRDSEGNILIKGKKVGDFKFSDFKDSIETSNQYMDENGYYFGKIWIRSGKGNKSMDFDSIDLDLDIEYIGIEYVNKENM